VGAYTAPALILRARNTLSQSGAFSFYVAQNFTFCVTIS
jgi:hypothetical protein